MRMHFHGVVPESIQQACESLGYGTLLLTAVGLVAPYLQAIAERLLTTMSEVNAGENSAVLDTTSNYYKHNVERGSRPTERVVFFEYA